jgi:hypothetical protein
VVFENARFRAVLGDDAVWRSFVDNKSGKEYCAAKARVKFADAVVAGKSHAANRASLSGARLTIGLAGCDTQLVYSVEKNEDWVAFRLDEIAGTRPSHVTVVRVGVTITQRVGSCLGGAWNRDYAVCLRGLNLQTSGHCSRAGDHVQLVSAAQDAPGPKLEGSGAAILATPPAELRGVLRKFAAAYDLPRNEGPDGTLSKDSPIARQSYWFLGFGEKEVDKVIDYCHRAGLRQVMMSSGAWCVHVGHYTFNKQQYPDGIESLRRTVAKLHAAGILVGMHTFASKVSKTDAYVTPVPRRDFWVDMRAELAGNVGPADKEIRTATDLSQWPGSPVCRQKVWEGHVTKHQEVILDDEIICYDRIGPEGKWDTFLGCRRGSYGTKPAPHGPKTDCRHYGVDGCINGYIIDLDSPLFEETTSRLAEIFNACDFDMVYFDGSEDVAKTRYNYYASKAHAAAMAKFKKRPLVHQGGGFTNELWFSFTRDATVDQYPGTYLAYLHDGGTIDKFPTCKDHIDRSVRYMLSCEDDMTPGELGWFGINPKSGKYDGLQYDEIEYLMCRSLAHNAPISLQTGFSSMDHHPLTPDILEIVRVYEDTRLAGKVPATVRSRLGQLSKDFAMLRGEREPVFVQVEEMPKVAGTHDVRAFVGAHGSDTIATLWHYAGKEGKLVFDSRDIAAYDVKGEPLKTERTGGGTAVPIDWRRVTLRFAGLKPDVVRGLLIKAKLAIRKPVVLWIRAHDQAKCVGNMTSGRRAGIRETGSLGDFILCSGRIDRSGKTPTYCEYRIDVPRKGRWTLWARVRYPQGGDMSFGLVRPGEPVTLTGSQVLGNCGLNNAQWHWTGQGGGVTSPPPGVPIVLSLPAGPFVFRIYPREGGGTAAANPRLDCLCLAEDPGYAPTDADAKAALAR